MALLSWPATHLREQPGFAETNSHFPLGLPKRGLPPSPPSFTPGPRACPFLPGCVEPLTGSKGDLWRACGMRLSLQYQGPCMLPSQNAVSLRPTGTGDTFFAFSMCQFQRSLLPTSFMWEGVDDNYPAFSGIFSTVRVCAQGMGAQSI